MVTEPRHAALCRLMARVIPQRSSCGRVNRGLCPGIGRCQLWSSCSRAMGEGHRGTPTVCYVMPNILACTPASQYCFTLAAMGCSVRGL